MNDLKSGFGSAAQKEQVYSGPPVNEGVNDGTNAGEARGNVNTSATQGQVYDEKMHTPKRVDSTVARKAVTKTIRFASLRFFLVALVSLAECIIYWNDQPTIALGAAAVAIVFFVVGIFALRLNRNAFLVAMGIYGLQTLSLLGTGIMDDGGIFFVIKPLIVHGIILYRLYKSYDLLVGLHSLEND